MPETITQDDWDSVYYDSYNGDYFMVSLRSDGVELLDPFTGEPFYNMTVAEFLDEEENYRELQPRTLRDPADLIGEALVAVQSAGQGDSTEARAIDGVELEFATRAVEFVERETNWK